MSSCGISNVLYKNKSIQNIRYTEEPFTNDTRNALSKKSIPKWQKEMEI